MTEIFEVYSKDDIDNKFSSLATPENISNINAQLADIVTVDVKQKGAKGDGISDDSNSCLNALSSIDKVNGGVLYLPPGVFKLNTKYLAIIGYNNIVIKGAGKGVTILDGTGILDYTQQGEWSPSIGILKIDGADSSTPAKNIKVCDLTIKKNTSQTSDRNQHNTVFGNVQNITFENVEFDGSYNEQVYTDGGQNDSAKHIRFINCDFKNCVQASTDSDYSQLDTNTIWCEDIIIEGCSFYNSSQAIMVLGSNIIIQGNNFKNVSRNPIYVGESNGTTHHSLGSCVIDGNTIELLGSGRGNNSPCQGIIVNGSSTLFSDGTEDIGCIVSNNSILNTRFSHSANIVAIQIAGSAKVNDNFIAGLQSEDGSTNNCYAIQTINPQNQKAVVYLSDNVVHNLKAANELKFNFGVYLTHQKDSEYYLSDNRIMGCGTDDIFLQPTTSGETAPLLSLTNDIINGALTGRGNIGDNALNTDGSLNNIPLNGTNKSTLYANSNPLNVVNLPANNATPSVGGLSLVQTVNTSATSYSNFTGGIGGQKLTLFINDSNTTILSNGTIRLSGNTNWVPPMYSTIEFQYNPTIATWNEIYRHSGS